MSANDSIVVDFQEKLVFHRICGGYGYHYYSFADDVDLLAIIMLLTVGVNDEKVKQASATAKTKAPKYSINLSKIKQ